MVSLLLMSALLASASPSDRQATLDAMVAGIRSEAALPIDWKKVVSITYAPDHRGSMTDAKDPDAIVVTIGHEPFECAGDLYSTLRHELVHVAQQMDQPRALREGWGYQEAEAYLWELENSLRTGLEACDRRGEDGGYDVRHGVARAIDGLFRRLLIMSNELDTGAARVSKSQLAALGITRDR